MKRNLQETAKAFQTEGKVSPDPVGMYLPASCHEAISVEFFVATNVECYCLLHAVIFVSAIDAPGGFLFEWWSVFWDIFIARTNEKHSDIAASYIQVCIHALSFFNFFSWLNLEKSWFYTTKLP